MVSKIIKLIHQEMSGVHQAAYALAVFAVGAQLLGLVRDRVLAHLFGAGQALDIYYAAFRVPDFLFLTVASVVSISVLIPFFIDRLEESYCSAKEFLDSIFSAFFVGVIVICALAFLAMPYLVPLLVPGFDSASAAQVVSLSRLLLLSPILLGLSNLLATVTQTYHRFILHSLSPVVYNLGIIIGAVTLAPEWGVVGVVYGVLIGASLHLLVQIPFVIHKGFWPRLVWSMPSPAIWRVILHSAPRRISLSIHHLAIIFLIPLASLMTVGSIAVFQFSFNLQSAFLSTISASYSVAAFPALTRFYSRGEMANFRQRVLTTARHIIIWSLPFTVLFLVLRAQIVRTVLGSGRFDWADTQLTAAALALFSLSLIFQGLMLLFVRGYFAVGNTKTPFLINMLSGLVIVTASLGLWWLFNSSEWFRVTLETWLRVEGLAGTSILVLPLGYTIGFLFNGLVMWVMFERDFQFRLRDLLVTAGQGLTAAAAAGYISYFALGFFSRIFDIQTVLGIFLQGLAAGLLGLLALVALLSALDNREFRELLSALRTRLERAPLGTQEAETLEN